MTDSTVPATGDEAPAPCSVVSARLGLALIGSAPHFDRLVAFELEAPWAARLVGSRSSDPALDAAIARLSSEAPGLRPLAIEPHRAEAGRARILVQERKEDAFRAYARREFDVPREALADALESIAFGEGPTEFLVSGSAATRDLLVCTHGSRDACCGKFGYPLYREFEALAEGQGGGATRVWRCSHLGGHRFAPTVLDLPSGRMFGRLGAGDARAVFGGGEALARAVATIYRGRTVLPEAAQIVEKELWLRHGAAVETSALSWSVEEGEQEWVVKMEACDLAVGLSAVLDARVVRDETDAVPAPASCGRDPENESPWKIVA